MKNKKCILGTLLIVFISLFIVYGIGYSYGATVDNTPPKLISLSISNNEVKPGEYLKLDLKATDDVSGLKRGSIGLYSPIKGYTVYQMDILDLNNPEILIPENAVGGNYLISFVMLMDNKNNLIVYDNKQLDPYADVKFDFGSTNVKILSDKQFGTDNEAPVVSNVTVDKQQIELGEEATICATITDESKIMHADVTISLDEENAFLSGARYEMEYNEEKDLYCTKVKPIRTGTNVIESISVTDEYDNGETYFRVNTTQDLKELEMPDIIVSGPANDTEAAVLKSIKINKSSVVAPSTITVFAEVTDNYDAPLNMLELRFISEKYYKENIANGTASDGEVYALLEYNELLGKYVGTLELDQYTQAGKYYLQKVSMTDCNMNASFYYTDYNFDGLTGTWGDVRINEKIDNVSFEVKEEFGYDAVTSTISENMIDTIKNQKDDATIMIDATNDYTIPEGVFEAIKGTNKTIYIEANGFQWVFNGKDIKNPKSIDAFIYTELLVDENIDNNEKDYIAIVFADNGELPGKAIIRVKTDYTFRYIEGYENLKLYFYNNKEEKYKELDNTISLSDDGFYEFEITHNSKYILSNKKISEELLTNNDGITDTTSSKKDGIFSKKGLYITAICTTVVLAGVLVIIKKKKAGK